MDIFLNWRKKNLITIFEFFESNFLIPDRYQLTLKTGCIKNQQRTVVSL